MRCIAGFLALAVISAPAVTAEAAFVVSFPTSPITITAGNTTPVQIPVMITGSTTDVVDEFNVSFLITRDPSNPIPPVAFPQFVNPASAATDPTFNDPNYIFNNGNSLFAGSSTFGFRSNPGTGFFTRFNGGDFSIADVTITSANNHLADLLVNSTVGSVTNAGGDRYLIALDLANSQFYHGNHVLIPSSSFTVNPGSIRVVMGSSVPEPSSVYLGLSAATLVSGWSLRRRLSDRGRTR